MIHADTPAYRPLHLDRTVPRNLVHRRSVHEVFLTDYEQVNDDEMIAAAEIPRTHKYFNDHVRNPSGPDPLLLIEISRQSGIVMTEEFLGAPSGTQLVLLSLSGTFFKELFEQHGERIAFVTVTTDVVAKRIVKGVPKRVTIQCTVRDEDTELGQFVFSYQCWPKALYSRKRGDLPLSDTYEQASASLVRPALVDRRLSENVLLSPLGIDDYSSRYKVVMDYAHGSMFDHPLDHVPGMAQLEAIRQVVQLELSNDERHDLINSPKPVRFSAQFRDFAELGVPLAVSIDEKQDILHHAAHIVLEQASKVITDCSIEFNDRPVPPIPDTATEENGR